MLLLLITIEKTQANLVMKEEVGIDVKKYIYTKGLDHDGNIMLCSCFYSLISK